ncbi:MAG: hypothetical protein M1484_04440 [Patescibacteria group bacterium]|nr:hypothetical protein [Patescibacteria group bacterium]
MAKRTKQTDEKQILKVPKELISREEYARRKRVWQDIYAKARQGEAYKRCLQMQEAIQTNNIAMMCKLRAEYAERILNGNDIPKPAFEDPDLDFVYGRIGIKENWEDKIEKAKKEGATIKT